MLVLRRKAGEAIVLNGTITIHVLAVEGERVKLGISAPPEVVIVRSELLEAPEQLQGAAVAVPATVASAPLEAHLPYSEGEEGPRIVSPSPEAVARVLHAGAGRSGSRNRQPTGAR